MQSHELKSRGFTLIEILIVIAIFAILSGIVFSSFQRVRRQMGLEESVHKLAQDIQKCRSTAIAKSKFCRVNFVGPHRYKVEMSSSRYGPWTSSYEIDLPVDITGSWSVGDDILFDSRSHTWFPSNPSPYQVTISKAGNTYVIVPTMIGAVRVVKQ